MPRFLIEASHAEEQGACARVVQIFLATGSHFLTHADWGCYDGRHSAWIMVDMPTKEDARLILPPPFRADATIVELNKFTIEEIDAILARHKS